MEDWVTCQSPVRVASSAAPMTVSSVETMAFAFGANLSWSTPFYRSGQKSANYSPWVNSDLLAVSV